MLVIKNPSSIFRMTIRFPVQGIDIMLDRVTAGFADLITRLPNDDLYVTWVNRVTYGDPSFDVEVSPKLGQSMSAANIAKAAAAHVTKAAAVWNSFMNDNAAVIQIDNRLIVKSTAANGFCRVSVINIANSSEENPAFDIYPNSNNELFDVSDGVSNVPMNDALAQALVFSLRLM